MKLFEKCPACGGPITIKEIQCPHCQLVMRGQFAPGFFSVLSDDQFTFIRAFLHVRGNLSELEKVLGVSYPTIRNKLDEINTVLDRSEAAERSDSKSKDSGMESFPASDRAGVSGQRQAILQQVAVGSLGAVEAIQLLKNIKGGEA